MTDADLIGKKIGRIEQHIRELRTLLRPEEIEVDLRAQRFAERVFGYSDRAWRQRRLFRRLREEGACSKHVTDERKWLRRREPARRRENT